MRQFVADASHELRTPLTTIRGFAELYRQGAAGRPGRRRHAGPPDRGRGRPDGPARRGPAAARPARPGAAAARWPRWSCRCWPSTRCRRPRRSRRTGRSSWTSRRDAGPLVVLGDDARLRQVHRQPDDQRADAHPAGRRVTLRLRAERRHGGHRGRRHRARARRRSRRSGSSSGSTGWTRRAPAGPTAATSTGPRAGDRGGARARRTTARSRWTASRARARPSGCGCRSHLNDDPDDRG